MNEQATSSPRSPATWTLVAFWVAWCLGPGVVFVQLIIDAATRRGLPRGETTEFVLLLVALAASVLTTVALGFIRCGPTRRPEYWLLLLFWLGAAVSSAPVVTLDPFTALPGLALMLTSAALIPCVTLTRFLRDATRPQQTR